MNDKANDFSAIVLSLINTAALIGFPGSVPAISMVSPFLQRIIERGFSMFHGKASAEIECARLGIAYRYAVDTINDNIVAGKQLRGDGFLESINNSQHTHADEIVEATLRNVINDAEIQKSILYGKLIGQMPFLSGYSVSVMVSLNNILRQLSTFDVENLMEFSDRKVHNLKQLEVAVKRGAGNETGHRFVSLIHLKNLGLIVRQFPTQLGLELENETISSTGYQLLQILHLV